MTTAFVFALTLLVAVLVSELADRSVLSTAVLFLVVGFFVGNGVFGVVTLRPDDPAVAMLAQLALFSILFTDGMRVRVKELVVARHLSGRALLLGLPLTFVGNAFLAHYVASLQWSEAFLIGAVLSPTDPVFASAIIGRTEVPSRLRQLLNIESGLNDGLALPVVVAMLAVVNSEKFSPWVVLIEVVAGIIIGVIIPWIAIHLEHSRFFAAHVSYRPLNGFAIGLLVYTIASLSGANVFLAAFAAGITVATIGPDVQSAFHEFGELIAELLKLAALLLFGSLISPRFLGEVTPLQYIFAILLLVAVRPLALSLSLLGSPISWRERAVAAWFGPKGFASVVFGLLILKDSVAGQMEIKRADHLFHIVAICVVGSIIAHSSTDVMIARRFSKESKVSGMRETA